MATHPEPTPYDRIGGAETARDIARRFYFLVENDPDYADLRAIHGEDLDPVQESLAGFLIGWLGGPRDWFQEGPGCIFGLHRPIAIDGTLAGQWSDAMLRAITADPRIDPALGRHLAEALAKMAHAMVNAPA